VEIRPATRADVDACFAVQKRSALVGYADLFPQAEYPFPDDVVRGEWVARLDGAVWVAIAVDDGETVGTVSVRGDRLEALFVVPERWGTGVADWLHSYALLEIAATGAATAELDVMADNLRARRFYERRGWRLDGREDVSPFPPYPRLVGYRRDLGDVSRSTS
jgi:GNAT superfamily N-acetyltransferase